MVPHQDFSDVNCFYAFDVRFDLISGKQTFIFRPTL